MIVRLELFVKEVLNHLKIVRQDFLEIKLVDFQKNRVFLALLVTNVQFQE